MEYYNYDILCNVYANFVSIKYAICEFYETVLYSPIFIIL